MSRRLRIAIVGPVAQPIPPPRSGSVESVTALLTEGLVARGHAVTLFATAASTTSAELHATFPLGYHEDPELWPWELCELLNLSAAVERAADFDVIHYQAEYAPISLAFARLTPTPLLVTVHHAPTAAEVALWSRGAEAPFVAISSAQAALLEGLDVVATIPHAVDTATYVPHATPEDYLLFLGRFTEGKGALAAIDVARRAGRRLVLAAAETDYYKDVVAPHVDGERVRYAGEVGLAEKVSLLARAAALLYPVQADEPFGLVLAEAMACGTPVAALARGAVPEIVDAGVTGGVFDSLDELIAGLPGVLALDRSRVRSRAVERFGPDRMIDAHVALYESLSGRAGAPSANRSPTRGRPSLLAVFAHPDDESLACGGLLALSAESGAHVSLLCLTRGEAGGRTLETRDGQRPACAPRDARAPRDAGGAASLGEVRSRELAEAGRVLGIEDITLLAHEDGMLPWLEPSLLEADIERAIERAQPDVVVTFDEDGLYWHPDHVAVHERVTAVVAGLGDTAPALFYVGLPHGAMRALVDHVGQSTGLGVLGVADVDAFGSHAPAPTLVVDAGRHAQLKLRALRCHRTQVEGTALAALDERDAKSFLGIEHYRRAGVGADGESFIERFGATSAARRG